MELTWVLQIALFIELVNTRVNNTQIGLTGLAARKDQ